MKVTEGAELPRTDAIKIQNLSSLITAPFRLRSGVFGYADVKIFDYFFNRCNIEWQHKLELVTWLENE